MPARKKETNICSKRNCNASKRVRCRRKRHWGMQNNIICRKFNNLNDMIYNYKPKETWKVVPKDSLEVYKDRRKRDSRRKQQEKKYGEDKRKENDTSGGSCRRCERCNSRRRDRESSSSYSSTVSCGTSCSSCMEFE